MKIRQKEIQDIAEGLGVPANTVDKDYVIGHFLNELFSRDWAQQHFLFKGGTCLKKCYFSNYRFSEDIDITVTDANYKPIAVNFQNICDAVFQKTEIAFNILKFEDVFSNDKLMGWDVKICFWGANHRKNEPPVFGNTCHSFLEIELRIHETIVLEKARRSLFHPYTDHEAVTNNIPCYSIHEILAEKMRSLLQRNRGEARDYFDLWYIKKNIADIDWTVTKEAFNKKCAFKNINFTHVDDFFQPGRVRQAYVSWDKRLAHQLPKRIGVEKETVFEELRTFLVQLF